METLIIYIKHSNNTETLECLAETSVRPDGRVDGKFVNTTKDKLAPLILPCEEERVYTFLSGKRYKVAELMEEGNFVLTPDVSEEPFETSRS